MTSAREDAINDQPVERFKPTTGIFLGYAGLVCVLVTLGYVLVSVHTVTGLRIGLGSAFAGVGIWVTQLRPRATAYPDFLRIKNGLIDTDIPFNLIDDVSIRQTLNVWVGEARYMCIGIGRARRSMLKKRGSGAAGLLGMGPLHEYAAQADRPEQNNAPYETFVQNRIEELVDAAKRELHGMPAQGRVRRLLAWPEVVALTVLGLGFVLSLFL